MSDILEICFDSFWAARGSPCQDPKLQARLETMLSSYDCFTKDLIYFAPQSQYINKNKNATQRHVRSQNDHMPKHRPKDPLHELFGILNKITVATYPNLLQKLLRFCAYKENIQHVTDTILIKCYSHGSFSPLYHKLLAEMYTRYEKQVQQSIETYVIEFSSDVPSELKYLMYQPNSRDYNDYCAYIKRKTKFLNQLENIIVITKTYGCSQVCADVYDVFINELTAVINGRDNAMLDYLGLLSQIIKLMYTKKSIPVQKIDNLYFIWNDIRAAFDTIPKKIQFSWESILTCQ